MSKFKYVLGMLLPFLVAAKALAIGGGNIGNEVPSARAAGQGYTGTAGQSDDPSVAYSNPAALTELPGTQITYGFHWENVHGQFESNSAQKTKMRSVDAYVPNASITHTFSPEKLSAGLGIQSPFGLETHWPSDSPLRYIATDSRLRMLNLLPGTAFRPMPAISLGAGLNYVNVFSAQLDKHINGDVLNRGTTTGASDIVSSLKGKGDGLGYQIAALLEPNEHHALGVVYRTKVKVRLKGRLRLSGFSGTDLSSVVFGGTSYETSAHTDINIPANVQLGYAYKPTTNWLFEVDAAWTHWSSGRDLLVRTGETEVNRLTALNAGAKTQLNLRDTWGFAMGGNYKVSDRWQLRSGFWFIPWATPEQTFNPAFMDLSRYGFNAGFGYKITSSLTLDLAYSAIFFKSRIINNDLDAATFTPLSSDGTYSNFANLLALNITHRFGGK